MRDGSITPGQHASFLGKAHNPLFFTQDPNSSDFGLPELSLPGNLPLDRQDVLKVVRATQKLVIHELRCYVRIPLVTNVNVEADRQTMAATTQEVSGGGIRP